jgi:periplasmic divalent cation tolerance protein
MIRLVITTFSGSDDAAKAVRLLVEERLAACGTILPGARSIYAWEGSVEDASEVVVVLKTSAAAWPALEARLREVHPYEVPEIIALDPESVSGEYAAWVAAHCLS